MEETWRDIAARLKFDENKSWTQTAKEIEPYFPDLTTQQVFEKVRSSLRELPRYKTRGKVTFEDKKDPTPQDVDAFYDLLKQTNAAIMKTEAKQTKATICIDDDKPIAVAFWGDWHIGCKGVEYDMLDADTARIAETDGLYVIGMGDYKDNASGLVHASSTQESVATTDMQDKIVLRVFEKTADKHLVTIRGCHDDWDKRNANKDFVQAICDLTGSVNLWHGGIVNLTVGKVEYRIGARHKFKFESSLNTTNTQRTFINENGHCDIIAVAHKHFCEVQHCRKMHEDTIFLRSGSYKRYDEFGQKLAGYEGMYGVPCVILFPNRREMIPFRDIDTAIAVLKGLRS